ncbi:MAG: arylesterase [Planctomycetes bacterium]|nr:arylesterase [Planctomycetota bacterium]MCB9871227.1 arylesterase [Planctomycetota bacterium]MCB9889799.1 arylesterase [Planctomycetota bacterium]
MRAAPKLWFVLLAACSDAAKPAPSLAAAEPSIPTDAPLVVFLGDSITAGLHLPEAQAFPAVVQRSLLDAGQPFRLVNAGSSGDTSAGGLRRIDWLLKQKPALVVVELGGNDGMRGQDVGPIHDNLEAILTKITAAGAKALLLGMRIPSSYGPDYTAKFAGVYDRLAARWRDRGVGFVPFFMKNLVGKAELFLDDGLHPSAAGQRVLAEAVTPAVAALLRR